MTRKRETQPARLFADRRHTRDIPAIKWKHIQVSGILKDCHSFVEAALELLSLNPSLSASRVLRFTDARHDARLIKWTVKNDMHFIKMSDCYHKCSAVWGIDCVERPTEVASVRSTDGTWR